MKKKSILITGANSFIGSYFKQNSPDFNVNELCVKNNKPSEIDFADTDIVFHVAAIVHQDKSIPDSLYFKVNSDLAFGVAKTAKQAGVKQFVFMSTVKVYGENSTVDNPWTEDSDCKPTDAYGKSKLDAEKRIIKLNDENFVVSIIRTPVVYGAGVKGNILRISKFVINNKFIPFKGINNKRAMVYIGNLVYLINEIIKQRKPGVFLANDKETISTSEFVNKIIKEANKNRMFIPIPKLFQNIIKIIKPNFYKKLFGSMVVNNEKTVQNLQLEMPYRIEYGIKKIVEGLNKTDK